MTVAEKNKYESGLGWSLDLPEGWEPMALSRGEGGLNAGSPPVVFWCLDDPGLSFTWMRTQRPISSDEWLRYSTATMLVGPVGSREAQRAVQEVCPVLGRAVEAEVVRLSDGNRALELVDEVTDDAGARVVKQGCHLILPVRAGEPGPLFMQRLHFYLDTGRFKSVLPAIRASMRSFRYE